MHLIQFIICTDLIKSFQDALSAMCFSQVHFYFMQRKLTAEACWQTNQLSAWSPGFLQNLCVCFLLILLLKKLKNNSKVTAAASCYGILNYFGIVAAVANDRYASYSLVTAGEPEKTKWGQEWMAANEGKMGHENMFRNSL